MAGELSFFELGTDDPERARVFYEGLFDEWKFQPGPSGEGFAIETPTISGGLHGGDAGAAPYAFFAVEDIEAALERVRELGGEILDMDVGDEESAAKFGRFKFCKDDQGSPFGLHEPPAGS